MAKAKYTRASDGYFQTKVWDGSYNADGTKHRTTVRSSKSSADLERKVNAIKESVKNRSYIVTSPQDVHAYAEEWLTLFKANRALNTKKMYERIINDFMDVFKGLSWSNITHRHIQAAVTAAADTPRTCQQLMVTLKQVVKSAIRDRLLPAEMYMELFEAIDVPPYHPEEKRPLTDVEKDGIFSADFTPKQKAFIYTLYYTGVRRGEALALTRFNFDFKTNELVINSSLAFDENDSYIKDTKSENGVRRIPMPEQYVRYMRDVYFPMNRSSTILFPMTSGEYMTKSSFRKFWGGIIKQINISTTGDANLSLAINLTPHVFRHNYCTELCYQVPAISFDTIAKWLGDTKAMVIEVYSHAMSRKENVPAILKNVFGDPDAENNDIATG